MEGTKAAMSSPRGRNVLRAAEAASMGPPARPNKLETEGITYEFITIRFGGMAARKRPMGRKAASAFRKSLKPSFPLKHGALVYILSLRSISGND